MIYFAFSDEYGKYIKERNDGFIRSQPYYVRATYFIKALEYKKLSNKFLYKKRKYSLPEDKEIKWSYLWSLRQHSKHNEEISKSKDYYFLKDHDYHNLIDFVEESLSLFHELDYVKILFTITDNSDQSIRMNETTLLKMHLEELLPRLEMEIQFDNSNLGIIFLDPISRKHNKKLRNAYFEICQENNMIDKYRHVKDSLNFEDSMHSVGIQLADYLAGCSSSFIKCQHREGYERGERMFIENVLPFLRKDESGKILGYGIREVPFNNQFRDQLSGFVSS